MRIKKTGELRGGETKIKGARDGGLVLIAFDSTGMPREMAAKINANGGLWETLVKVLPALRGVGRVEQPSSPGGMHIHLRVKDAADGERFLRALHDRCWLAGYGWSTVSPTGQLLERSLVMTKLREEAAAS
jgi:hypothetical protein